MHSLHDRTDPGCNVSPSQSHMLIPAASNWWTDLKLKSPALSETVCLWLGTPFKLLAHWLQLDSKTSNPDIFNALHIIYWAHPYCNAYLKDIVYSSTFIHSELYCCRFLNLDWSEERRTHSRLRSHCIWDAICHLWVSQGDDSRLTFTSLLNQPQHISNKCTFLGCNIYS